MRFTWFIVNLLKRIPHDNLAPVLLDVYKTNKLCFTAVVLCSVREFAKLVRLLYSLAEEDLSETVIKYQKGKTVSCDMRQFG